MAAVFWWDLWTDLWRSTQLLLSFCWATTLAVVTDLLLSGLLPFETSYSTPDQGRSNWGLQWLELDEKSKYPGAGLSICFGYLCEIPTVTTLFFLLELWVCPDMLCFFVKWDHWTCLNSSRYFLLSEHLLWKSRSQGDFYSKGYFTSINSFSFCHSHLFSISH